MARLAISALTFMNTCLIDQHRLKVINVRMCYQITLLAIECIAECEDRLTALKKEVYLPVSEKLNCNYATVEATIRRTSERAWKSNPDLVCRIAFQKLDGRPQARRFLEALYRACCDEPEYAKEAVYDNDECSTKVYLVTSA